MLALIPQPQRVRELPGRYSLPQQLKVAVDSRDYLPAANALLGGLHVESEWFADDSMYSERSGAISIDAPGLSSAMHIGPGRGLPREGYRLLVSPEGVRIEAGSPLGAQHAAHTLVQLAASPDELYCAEIEDWPDFAARGLYYDVSRGRVPRWPKLAEMAVLLGGVKLNQLQLYIEHTFSFSRHPSIGAGCSPLTPGFMLDFDGICHDYGIELVPSLACFGHMSKVLKLPEYRHLAEDWGEGRYLDPEAKREGFEPGWSLAPANPGSYTFLAELFEEFLPCFSSKLFNVCCDETYDLGWGQSYELAKRIGKGRLYLEHLLKLRELSAAQGKEIMYWGDIIRSYPELIPELPRGSAVLDWGYAAQMDFARIRDFTATGLPAYVCPTVSGYVTLFPRIHESMANIAGWAQAGREHGAAGLLNTDWGDGGHYNFMECAWPGYLFGAEQAWNAGADRGSFLRRFCSGFLGIEQPGFTDALVRLGDVAQTHVEGFYQSFWRHVFFASPGDAILEQRPRRASLSTDGEIYTSEITPSADLGSAALRELRAIRREMENYDGLAHVDQHGVLPYWLFAVDTLIHAARKLTVLCEDRAELRFAKRELREELGGLRERFVELWSERNQPSEIGITLALYDRVLAGLAV